LKVFITGGNGFIGSVVVRQLISAGHDVRLLLRPTSRVDRIADLRFERAAGDVRDLASVRAGMSGCDCTIHLAAPGGWEAETATTLATVIENGTRNVLTAAEGLPSHRVVHVSSTAAVSASSEPRIFDERTPFNVSDDSLKYAHAKHRAELKALEAFRQGVPVVIVNPAEVYGPNDTALGTAGNLVDFAKSIPVMVCTGGTSVVHVDDVAAGIIAALQRGRPGERYILGGENVTIRQLAELVLELVGRRAPIVTVPNGLLRLVSRAAVRTKIPVPFNPHAAMYATHYWFVNNTKARRELGVTFRPARRTVAATIEWLRSAGHL
jgi:dihydroflavonol-4-reductase